MSRGNWSEVERVLSTVIDLPKEERKARVSQLCSSDPQLRAEVESLLAAHESAQDSFLRCGALAAGKLSSDFSMAGKQLGPYRLLDAVGAGGMGTVYSAERTDGQFQKTVAIKVALGALHSPTLLKRFLEEQQILANLEHANIARLLDAGVSPEGIPYLVMEYVEGTPLNEYVRMRRLGLRDRLSLFQAICAAVSYAHQHLVVHRDIKPGNILVAAEGTPKLLDFGIAKIVDEWRGSGAQAQQSLLHPMTPDYASPEQACGGSITTATDIYSLGVVLYELVVNRAPYQVAGRPWNEVVRTLCDEEPEKPSRALRRNGEAYPGSAEVNSDLDAVVAKAMRKDPRERYASSLELARDLSQYLSGRPVSAQHRSIGYVGRKFIARHKLGAGIAGLAAAMTVAGVTTIAWEAQIARQQRQKALHRFDQVRALAKSLIFEVHDSIRDLPGATPARQLIVNRALEYLDGLSKEAGGDVSLQREVSAAYERVADVQGNPYVANLGDAAGATASYRKALTIRESLLQADPENATLKAELSGTYWKMGICADANSNHGEALLDLRKALTLTEEAGIATDRYAKDRLAGDHWALARVLQETGELKEAFEHYQKAASLREPGATDDASLTGTSRMHLAGDYHGMAEVLRMQGRYDAAIETSQESTAILEELLRNDPGNATLRQYLAGAYVLTGTCYEGKNLLPEAIASYRRAQVIHEGAVASDPSDALSLRLVGFTRMQVGRALVERGQAGAGLRELLRALAVFHELARKAPDSHYMNYNFGNVYRHLGEAHASLALDNKAARADSLRHWQEARSWFVKSLAIWIELRRQGKLAGPEGGEPERLPGEIAKCDQAIERLSRHARASR